MCQQVSILKNAGLEVLPDNKQWELRFEIESETSDNIYIIARHKTNKNWACSCFAYRRYRSCKHLKALKNLLEKVDKTEEKLLTME